MVHVPFPLLRQGPSLAVDLDFRSEEESPSHVCNTSSVDVNNSPFGEEAIAHRNDIHWCFDDYIKLLLPARLRVNRFVAAAFDSQNNF